MSNLDQLRWLCKLTCSLTRVARQSDISPPHLCSKLCQTYAKPMPNLCRTYARTYVLESNSYQIGFRCPSETSLHKTISLEVGSRFSTYFAALQSKSLLSGSPKFSLSREIHDLSLSWLALSPVSSFSSALSLLSLSLLSRAWEMGEFSAVDALPSQSSVSSSSPTT